jgi:hypothetical protein
MNKRRNHERPTKTWDEIKVVIRRRFILNITIGTLSEVTESYLRF